MITSDGVVVFLILSVAEEVCAIICSTLPVVIPQIYREYKQSRASHKSDATDSSLGATPRSRTSNKGFKKLNGGLPAQSDGDQDLSGQHSNILGTAIPLNTVVAKTLPQVQDPGDVGIVVKKEFQISRESRHLMHIV